MLRLFNFLVLKVYLNCVRVASIANIIYGDWTFLTKLLSLQTMARWNTFNKLKLTFDTIYFPVVWTIYMIFQSNASLPSKCKNPSSIFMHKTTTDIILKIENCEFHAHREILASRSRVLNDFLKQNTSHVVSVFIKHRLFRTG